MKGKIKLLDNIEIDYYLTSSDPCKPLIILVHGVTEYYGRHSYLADLLVDKNNILFYSHRGQGKSDGRRAYIDDFEIFVDDMCQVISFAKENFSFTNYSLFSHSMGGIMTSMFIKNYSFYKKKFNIDYPFSIYMSTPAVSIAGAGGLLLNLPPLWFIKFLAKLKFSLKLYLIFGNIGISSLKEEVKKSDTDPEMNTYLESKLLFQIAYASRFTFQGPLDIKCKSIVVFGSKRKIIDSKSINEYFTSIEPTKCLVIFGGYHELYSEALEFKIQYNKSIVDFFRY